MEGRLTDRRIVLTGAAGGIGRATAMRLLSEGGRVALVDMAEQDALDIDVDSVQCRYWQADVRDPEGIAAVTKQIVDWLSGVDVLLHVAGIMRAQQVPPEEVSLETWQEVIDTNLRGSFLVVKELLPSLTETQGAIVLTSSKGGVWEGSGSVPYGASKGGVHGLALTLERALGPRGIRVNELVPGSIDTPLYRASVAEAVDRTGDPDLAQELLEKTVGPDGTAAVLAFLASEDAAHVQGSIRTR